jgi:hypothetical protein
LNETARARMLILLGCAMAVWVLYPIAYAIWRSLSH